MLRKIYTEALKHAQCYANLDYLCNKIGGRLAGSPQAQQAVEWSFRTMKNSGADSVFMQECLVPHWVRGGKEIGQIRSTKSTDDKDRRLEVEAVKICALGGSVATPWEGILADVLEVQGVDELYKLGAEKIKGKIVFFNRPFDNSEIDPFNAYGKAVDQRWKGPSIAAKFGAVATVCRSMTTLINDVPHTGSMQYLDSIPEKIPACAISTWAAERLSSLLKSSAEPVQFYLNMSCQTLPDEKSCNVVAELKGWEHPEKIIVVGGHLDSWETGDGAQDDGAGVVQSIEVIRILKALGIKPRFTIRAVAFINEENGLRGGLKYGELAAKNKEQHVLAIETDRGGFTPRGFTFSGSAEQRKKLFKWKPLFEPYGVYDFTGKGGGGDISPLEKQGVPLMELYPDPQRYFDYHHTADDTFKSVNKRELEMGAATLAAMVYLVSEHGF